MSSDHKELSRPAEPYDERITQQRLSQQKARDRAFLLPLIGFIFLMPPIASIFLVDIRVLGIPLTLLYLFLIWAALIAGAVALSRTLRHDDYMNESGSSEADSVDESH